MVQGGEDLGFPPDAPAGQFDLTGRAVQRHPFAGHLPAMAVNGQLDHGHAASAQEAHHRVGHRERGF